MLGSYLERVSPTLGHIVTCVDRDAAKITSLQSGKMPIYEPGLSSLVETNVPVRNDSPFSTDVVDAVDRAEAIFIAVGTPDPRR